MTTHRPTSCLPFLLAAFLIATLCWSQTGTGNIQGTVQDTSGAVVPKAKVTLVHVATNRQYDTETNDVGFYLVPSIGLGDYQLTVTSAGMQTWKGQLRLLAGQTVEVGVTLTPGSTATTIEVAGDVAPLVTTTSATLSTIVEPERIQQLPINGRDVNQLIYQTTPGALQETHGVNGVLWVPRIFGLRNASELVQDGAPLTDKAWGTEPNRPPGIDTIAELRAETSNSSAEFDRPGTFIMTTKSGTNQFHGAAFETNRTISRREAVMKVIAYRPIQG
jgi:carboxypeptidase family protein